MIITVHMYRDAIIIQCPLYSTLCSCLFSLPYPHGFSVDDLSHDSSG
jgi:hypothetical protein